MDYDDDLSAPVWDELNENSTPAVDELSGALSNLSTHEPSSIVAQNSQSQDPQIAHESHENSLDGNDSSDTEKQDQVATSNHLLEELAPENEALSELKLSTNSVPASPLNNTADPLFSASTYLPLIGGENPLLGEEIDGNNMTDQSSSPRRKMGRPQRLFNSARIRRRPLSSNTESLIRERETANISDPLGESKKESEFTDEPLDESPLNADKFSKNNNIVDLVDEPLFKLSPRKKSNTNLEGSEENNDSEASGDQKQAEQIGKLEDFEIEVKDPVKVGELTSLHVEYTVITKSCLLENQCAQVNRRYTDFRWLYRQLQSNHWGVIIPPPPEKQSVGRFKQDFIENRRFQMERMLRKIVTSPTLQKDPDFLMFLSSTDFVIESKNREHISGSAASNDSNDLSEIHISEIGLLGADDAAVVMKNGGIDSESQKRFMNISFSSPPKYIEADEYFREQWHYAETLEQQLKQLDKSLELVDAERNQLASVTEEFSKAVESLAELEVTKKNANLLANFAETHRRIKESLERNSLQESLTLGVTLDEYVRSLASLKAIFNQRAKLGQYLVIVEGDLLKKESQLEKLHHIFKTQPSSEKVQIAKKDYQVLQARFINVKKNWQAVGIKIKDEIDAYQLEKIQDFRNSIEIFLESTIESQKENIELWETFYQNNL